MPQVNLRYHLGSIDLYQRALGFMAGIKWHFFQRFDRRRWLHQKTVRIRPSFLKHPVAVRTQDSSDADVFNQLYIKKELAFLDQLPTLRRVTDLGANVGYFSTLVLSKFSEATVLAVEPDPGNAELCRLNLAPYGARAAVIEGAAWHS